MRIAVAILFILYGTQKLFSYPVPEDFVPVNLFSLMGLAGILETFGGLAILLGIFTQPVAFILSGEMAVAYFMGHAFQNFWPLYNGGEPAVSFCFTFLYLAAAGAGPWSLDAAWRGVKGPSGVLTQWEPQLRSVLRIVVAFLFIPHGSEDMIGWPRDPAAEPFAGPDFSIIQGYAHLMETVLGPLVLLGLFTRPLCFLFSGEMAVAYFYRHVPRGFWPILNGGEDAAFFCWVFLFFAAAGGGPWALDKLRERRGSARNKKPLVGAARS
jgi:putative oxidoreductase